MELSSFVDIACTLHPITTIILVIESNLVVRLIFCLQFPVAQRKHCVVLKGQKLN